MQDLRAQQQGGFKTTLQEALAGLPQAILAQ